MYLYIELWKPRQNWLEMSEQERSDYVAGIRPKIEKLTERGIEMMGVVPNDDETPHRAHYRYIAA